MRLAWFSVAAFSAGRLRGGRQRRGGERRQHRDELAAAHAPRLVVGQQRLDGAGSWRAPRERKAKRQSPWRAGEGQAPSRPAGLGRGPAGRL